MNDFSVGDLLFFVVKEWNVQATGIVLTCNENKMNIFWSDDLTIGSELVSTIKDNIQAQPLRWMLVKLS